LAEKNKAKKLAVKEKKRLEEKELRIKIITSRSRQDFVRTEYLCTWIRAATYELFDKV